VWRFIISWHFFLFSLFPKNLGLSPFFSYFNFNSYSFYFYFFFTYRSFICFQFSPWISIWHILSFPARSLLFWFVILFLWPFCDFFFNLFINYNLSYIIFFNLILLLLISNFFPWLFFVKVLVVFNFIIQSKFDVFLFLIWSLYLWKLGSAQPRGLSFLT
jgi:hypothetical protein